MFITLLNYFILCSIQSFMCKIWKSHLPLPDNIKQREKNPLSLHIHLQRKHIKIRQYIERGYCFVFNLKTDKRFFFFNSNHHLVTGKVWVNCHLSGNHGDQHIAFESINLAEINSKPQRIFSSDSEINHLFTCVLFCDSHFL